MLVKFLEDGKTAMVNPPKTKHKISDFHIGDVWWCYFPWVDEKELKDLHPAVILDHGASGTQLLSLRTTHYKDEVSYNRKYELPLFNWRMLALDKGSSFVLNSIQDDVEMELFTKDYIGQLTEFDWLRLREALPEGYKLDKKPGRRLKDEE